MPNSQYDACQLLVELKADPHLSESMFGSPFLEACADGKTDVCHHDNSAVSTTSHLVDDVCVMMVYRWFDYI